MKAKYSINANLGLFHKASELCACLCVQTEALAVVIIHYICILKLLGYT